MGDPSIRGVVGVEHGGGRRPIVWGDDWNDKKNRAQLDGPIRNHHN